MHTVELSKSDSKVLAQVFDPESGASKAEVIIDPSLPAERHIPDATVLAELRMREKEAIHLIEEFETSGLTSADGKTLVYRQAMAILDAIVVEQPEYASALNNRAQLRRWYWGDRNMLCQPRKAPDQDRKVASQATVRDLKRSIAVASPGRPTDAVSPTQGRLLAQSYTQLGALYYAAAKDLGDCAESDASDIEVVDVTLGDLSKDGFEEEASGFFYLGGLYGNEVAKALAVHANPQAKLCGNIVKEAMRKEMAMAS